jgi:hypothetical protein
MKRIVTVVAAGAVAMFLVRAEAASANCLGAPVLKPIAYQSGSAGFAPQIGSRSPFEPTVREHRDAEAAVIVGLWKVTFTAGGQVTDVGFDAWHSDGTETLNDVSPISHNVCLGVWKQTGPRRFELKHMVLRFDASGAMIGTAILRETNIVNREGDVFTGTFTIDFLDLEGHVVFSGAGEVAGERVTVE